MDYFSKRVFILPLFLFSFLYAEPSLYGFGEEVDFIAPKSQKVTLFSLQQKIDAQQERIEGLTSLVEGLSASLSEIQNKEKPTTESSGEELVKKLATMIDGINANYVTKSELKALLNGKKSTSKKSVVTQHTPPPTLSTRYTQAVRDYSKKRYTNAKEGFEWTDTKGYKSAPSNYYLGEIAYYTKNYNDAIFYFKKSAGLNDKASYIDVLFLHIALSLEKTGKIGQAKAFYAMILQNHKGTKSAEIAKKNMEHL